MSTVKEAIEARREHLSDLGGEIIRQFESIMESDYGISPGEIKWEVEYNHLDNDFSLRARHLSYTIIFGSPVRLDGDMNLYFKDDPEWFARDRRRVDSIRRNNLLDILIHIDEQAGGD